MIPKKIHYCWFGRGEKPKLAQKCIASWKQYCPDYEIIEWNEDNFDVFQNGYTKYCYENQKWAFLSDYARLVIVYEQGGIYFDTDVEVIRSFDPLLSKKAFFGFENNQHVASGLGFGAEPGNQVVAAMLKKYEPLLDGEHGTIGCPILNTEALVDIGLELNGEMQNLEDVIIYPADYFNPYDDPTGRLNKTSNTYSIHWYAKTWMSNRSRIRSHLTKPLHRMFGTNLRRRS